MFAIQCLSPLQTDKNASHHFSISFLNAKLRNFKVVEVKENYSQSNLLIQQKS